MESIGSKLKILVPDPSRYDQVVDIRSYLSFAPYYNFLKERIQKPNEPFLSLYQYLINKLEENPELLQPINNPETIFKHEELFQLIAATLFPFSTDGNLQYYALGSPYKFEFFFYSDSFTGYFRPDKNGHIKFPKERPLAHIRAEYEQMAYRQVFRKFFDIEINIPERRTNQWVDNNTGLNRYSRVHIDESFIEVSLQGALPSLTPGLIDPDSGSILNLTLLKKQLPLSLFLFEGFTIRRSIADVTVEECVKEVKNAIIEMQSANPEPGYNKLRLAVETMIGTKGVVVSLNTFLQLNDEFVYYPKYSDKSILLAQHETTEEKENTFKQLALLLNQVRKPVLFNNMQKLEADHNHFSLVSHFRKSNYCCYIIAPLFENDKLIGMMEAVSPTAGVLNNETLHKLEPVFSYLEMACLNEITQFNNEIESLILEKYTALLPVVEWKFREEAWIYLKEKENDPRREIGTVKFNPVYPVYGAIDVKNSSIERRLCYQKDIQEQLSMLDDTLRQLLNIPQQSIKESVQKFLEMNSDLRKKTANILLPEDELKINEFVGHEVRNLFKKLIHSGYNDESLKHYLESVDHTTGQLNKHRRNFDESIGEINSTISRYLENEEGNIQQIHPHYFEKFRSDGVEYIIYVGDSFTPGTKFDLHELKKIRFWQLWLMAKITRITRQLQLRIPIPLETTQLVLVFNKPISISFRRDERRFDVEGQESVQFEILKKRIDKVKIKSTGERLTKPGTIAIVYSNSREIADYDEYFQLLKNENLIVGEKEMFNLEDVQSISGLKALRITVNVD